MIIDMHVHIGTILTFDMSEKTVIDTMNQHGIEFALVSNVEGSEVDFEQKPIPYKQQKNQIEINERVIQFAYDYPDRIGALIWIRPREEKCDEAFEEMIRMHRKTIYGLKLHPFHSAITVDDERVKPYIELARNYHLPILVHTANDECSKAIHVYNAAKLYPDVVFIMAHMELGSNHEEAIQILKECDNVYGDSAWVTPEDSYDIIETCGAHKYMFGTDNPVNGLMTYEDPINQEYLIGDFQEAVGDEAYGLFMGNVARNVFHIE